jgi:hypothetical protein
LDADGPPDRQPRHHEMEFPLRTHALLALGPLAIVIAMAGRFVRARARARGPRVIPGSLRLLLSERIRDHVRRRGDREALVALDPGMEPRASANRPPIEPADRRTSRRPGGPDGVEQRLYEITIPALSLETEFPAVRRRLLADFPRLVEVLAMSTPGTVLIAYRGEDEVDAWCEAVSDAVATRRRSHSLPTRRPSHGRRLEGTKRARQRPVAGEARKRGPREPRADRRPCPRLVRRSEASRATIRRRGGA